MISSHALITVSLYGLIVLKLQLQTQYYTLNDIFSKYNPPYSIIDWQANSACQIPLPYYRTMLSLELLLGCCLKLRGQHVPYFPPP